jgi:hypothetical protein
MLIAQCPCYHLPNRQTGKDYFITLLKEKANEEKLAIKSSVWVAAMLERQGGAVKFLG